MSDNVIIALITSAQAIISLVMVMIYRNVHKIEKNTNSMKDALINNAYAKGVRDSNIVKELNNLEPTAIMHERIRK